MPGQQVERVEADHPVAVLVGDGRLRLAQQPDGQPLAGPGGAPDRHGHAALQDHVIGQDAGRPHGGAEGPVVGAERRRRQLHAVVEVARGVVGEAVPHGDRPGDLAASQDDGVAGDGCIGPGEAPVLAGEGEAHQPVASLGDQPPADAAEVHPRLGPGDLHRPVRRLRRRDLPAVRPRQCPRRQPPRRLLLVAQAHGPVARQVDRHGHVRLRQRRRGRLGLTEARPPPVEAALLLLAVGQLQQQEGQVVAAPGPPPLADHGGKQLGIRPGPARVGRVVAALDVCLAVTEHHPRRSEPRQRRDHRVVRPAGAFRARARIARRTRRARRAQPVPLGLLNRRLPGRLLLLVLGQRRLVVPQPRLPDGAGPAGLRLVCDRRQGLGPAEGLQRRARPGGLDHAHRDLQRLLHLPCEELRQCGNPPAPAGARRDPSPAAGGLRRFGCAPGHDEVANRGQVRPGDLCRRAGAEPQLVGHVQPPAADPHLADQHVAAGDAVGPGHFQHEGPPRCQRAQRRPPRAVVARQHNRPLPAEGRVFGRNPFQVELHRPGQLHRDLLARRGRSPDGRGLAPLKDHPVGEDAREPHGGAGRTGRRPTQHKTDQSDAEPRWALHAVNRPRRRRHCWGLNSRRCPADRAGRARGRTGRHWPQLQHLAEVSSPRASQMFGVSSHRPTGQTSRSARTAGRYSANRCRLGYRARPLGSSGG